VIEFPASAQQMTLWVNMQSSIIMAEMLCSSECLNNCPNLIDLYISLAAGEG
jgi:hypothetical protein